MKSGRENDQKRAQTPERKELQPRAAQARRDEAKSLGLCKDCPNPAVPGPDQVRNLRRTTPAIPKAGRGTGRTAEGAGIQTKPHLLKTTPDTGRGPSSRPGTGIGPDVFHLKGLRARKTKNAWKCPVLGDGGRHA